MMELVFLILYILTLKYFNRYAYSTEHKILVT